MRTHWECLAWARLPFANLNGSPNSLKVLRHLLPPWSRYSGWVVGVQWWSFRKRRDKGHVFPASVKLLLVGDGPCSNCRWSSPPCLQTQRHCLLHKCGHKPAGDAQLIVGTTDPIKNQRLERYTPMKFGLYFISPVSGTIVWLIYHYFGICSFFLLAH